MNGVPSLSGLLINAVIVGAVSIFFNAVFYYWVTRRESQRDQQIRDMTESLRQMKQEKLKVMEGQIGQHYEYHERRLSTHIEDDGQKRSTLYKRMEDTLMTRREFASVTEHQTRIFDEHSKRLGGFQAELSDLNRTLSGSAKIVELIASRLNINLGDNHGQ